MFGEIEVRFSVDSLEHKIELDSLVEKVVYTGIIDAYFGLLEYHSVRFETGLNKPNFQDSVVMI